MSKRGWWAEFERHQERAEDTKGHRDPHMARKPRSSVPRGPKRRHLPDCIPPIEDAVTDTVSKTNRQPNNKRKKKGSS